MLYSARVYFGVFNPGIVAYYLCQCICGASEQMLLRILGYCAELGLVSKYSIVCPDECIWKQICKVLFFKCFVTMNITLFGLDNKTPLLKSSLNQPIINKLVKLVSLIVLE